MQPVLDCVTNVTRRQSDDDRWYLKNKTDEVSTRADGTTAVVASTTEASNDYSTDWDTAEHGNSDSDVIQVDILSQRDLRMCGWSPVQ